MAYKYLNDDGLKAYTKKIKGALKDLHTPIAISTENTTESMEQNVRNIADFVAKAKAAGITDVNGMAVTCIINEDYSGVGYLYSYNGGPIWVTGIITYDDTASPPIAFFVNDEGLYAEREVLVKGLSDQITSLMLTQGARRPIILTPETTEVDEETYQKLLVDDVDVMFKTDGNNYCVRTYKEAEGVYYFSALSVESTSHEETYLYGYKVSINDTAPHKVTIEELYANDISNYLYECGFINNSTLSPVLQEIDLTGTDAERKDKLANFEIYWKALTGASDLTGARFVGKINSSESNTATVLLQYNSINVEYEGISISDDIYPKIQTVRADPVQGYLTITPLFSYLEPVEIFTDNSAASKQKNLNNLNAYKANLELLGVDTSMSFQIPIQVSDAENIGFLYFSYNTDAYTGIYFQSDTDESYYFSITSSGEVFNERQIAYLNQIGFYTGEVIKLKDSSAQADLTLNKQILSQLISRLNFIGVNTSNGYQASVVVTSNGGEYTGTLNIGTGALLSGIVTDANETHHYPFHIEVATGKVTFDKTNYFLEKTSNEVTEMLDAIKYSYTPVSLTATTSTNKTQLDLFLSKVSNAQVMHCTYKDVYAGTLHKINGSWYGVLVGESNTLAGQLSIKLQADGTIVEGTA